MSRYQENTRHKRMWFGTQHHSEWITCPLRGAEMTPESWGTEGTYLSGGGFVRQSQDSHRQYIFEWSGASSRASAETLQAYRDGVYNKAPSDLLYFIDPLMYSRNILPKRWAQPGILTKPGEAEYSSIGVVAPVDTPVSLLGKQRVPMVGAQVSSPIGSLNDLLQRTSPGVGAIWVPIPEGETLTVIAWTGNPATSESGLYLKAQTSGGTWRSAEMVGTSGVIVSDAKGVLLATVGTFDYYGARAIIGRGDDWNDPVVYEWTGTPNDSTPTRTTQDGTVTNLFTNPDMVATDGEVVVWENLVLNPSFETGLYGWTPQSDVIVERVNGSGVQGGYAAQMTRTATSRVNGVMRGNVIPAESGDIFHIQMKVRRSGSTPAPVALLIRGAESRDNYWILEDDDWKIVADEIEVSQDGNFQFYIGPQSDGVDTVEGASILVDEVVVSRHPILFYHDETYSPDPDLTPQARPGGGSELVGQQVAGLSAENGVVVQSEQWSKSGGKSARFINNTGEQIARVNVTLAGVETATVWRYQDETLTPGSYGNYLGRIYWTGGGGVDRSNEAPNQPGETLLRVQRDESTSDVLRLWGSAGIGESVYFDLFTPTDEPYDGPPFSGSSPAEGPSWLPGSGHSGCKFVGNPTWIANSGVNGGQIGYAATLKEVGDWQL